MTVPLTDTTAQDIIKTALKVLGVKGIGDNVSDDEYDECLQMLNMMVDEWNLKSTLPYYKLNEVFDLVAGQYEYTIGVGGDFNTSRPIQILSAFNRSDGLPGGFPIDRRMKIIDNDSYQRIVSKFYAETYPDFLMYTPEYPLGKITVAGKPIAGLELGLSQVKQLGSFTLSDQTVTMPPGYLLALSYNLAVLLAPIYGKEVAGTTVGEKARESLGDIQVINSDPPLSKIDSQAMGSRRRSGTYNIYEG